MKNNEETTLVDYLITFYEDLLKSAIIKEEYENAIKYKKFIDNLKKSKND
jgi:protein-arginine kinase activator protein McsA